MELVGAHTAGLLKGEPSPQILALRETCEQMNIPRRPKKAVSRELRAEIQGALFLGDLGVAVPKPAKLSQYILLCLELLRRGSCKLRELQVVCGGFVYFCTFRRPLLCALNKVWTFMGDLKAVPPVVRLPLPVGVVAELLRFVALVPFAQMCFKLKVMGTVTCSDASQFGGGVCHSTGLTPYGQAAAVSQVRGDVPDYEEACQVLSVGLFDGVGALRVACDFLQLPMAGHISIGSDPGGRRVVEPYFPDSVFHDDVRTVDETLVLQWSLQFSNVGLVLVGGGPPCQGVSGLNADKRACSRKYPVFGISSKGSFPGLRSALSWRTSHL